MKFFTLLSAHILTALFLLQGWFVLAGMLILLISVRYTAYTIIPIAILVDAYFGAFYSVPLLSIYATLWCVFVEYFRPQLLIVQSSYGRSS